jgi:hypothetical protein
MHGRVDQSPRRLCLFLHGHLPLDEKSEEKIRYSGRTGETLPALSGGLSLSGTDD